MRITYHASRIIPVQCDWQPYLMKVPRNTPTDATSSHGLPLSSSMTPQLMKKANSKNTMMARANFIGADSSESASPRKQFNKLVAIHFEVWSSAVSDLR